MALPPAYKFVSCCDGYEIWFKYDGTINNPDSIAIGLLGVYKNTGSNVIGYGGVIESDKCYTVSIVTGNSAPPVSLPNLPAGTGSVLYGPATECGPNELCPPCTNPQKLIFNLCCGGSIEFQYDSQIYVDEVPALFQYTDTTIYNGLKPDACFTIELAYITEEEYSLLPSAPGNSAVTVAGKDCDEPDPEVECGSCFNYYQIINCANTEEVYCTTSNLSLYISNDIEDPISWPTITVAQHPNKCFYVLQVPECTGATTITVLSNQVSCAKCQAKLVVYYKLIDCNDPQSIVYTSTDLSLLEGKYITLEEYGDTCFFVEVYDGLVPSDIPVTPTGESYDTCEECTLPRYLLSDCTNQESDIVTNTDLSAYVGKVITIESCPGVCWEVEETELSPLYEITVVADYEDCPECLSTLPSKCVAFKNTGAQEGTVVVIFPDGTTGAVNVPGDTTSNKDCYITWELPSSKIQVVEFGLCVNGVCPPEPSKPRRRVTPGYDTPACTPEYYENVECHFSEWMYKEVLKERYGISNCCPEELMKWEIKHEMLMLDALINPDYDCQPDNSCCNTLTSTCNSCGCSSCNCNC